MRCKTHIAAGNALMLLTLSPDPPKELLISIGACTIGSIISDLDVRTSETHKLVDFLTAVSFIAVLVAYILDIKYNYGIYTRVKQGIFYLPIVGLLSILGVSFFGSHQPHRSFMHSFLGVGILSLIIYICFGKIWLPFFIGMISHILLDIFNKKNIRLFYPSKMGFCFKLCEFGGLVDNICFYTAIIICILKLVEL